MICTEGPKGRMDDATTSPGAWKAPRLVNLASSRESLNGVQTAVNEMGHILPGKTFTAGGETYYESTTIPLKGPS